MKYVGIDLGTTYSCISVMDENDVEPKPCPDGKLDCIPSYVWFDENDNPVVGELAKFKEKSDAFRVVKGSKRLLGTGQTCIIHNKDGSTKEIAPEIISEHILRHLINLESFKERIGNDSYKCIVTVPANYPDDKKKLVTEAAIRAGLPADTTTRAEPVAAAVSYVSNKGSSQCTGGILIFDLGGGTLDVTVANVSPVGEVELLTTLGVPVLGGNDWDAVIVEDLCRQYALFSDRTVEEVLDNSADMYIIKEKAEIIKKNITAKPEEGFKDSISTKSPFKYHLTEKEFEARTKHLMDRALDCIDGVLNEVENETKKRGIKNFEIKNVALVGGSSYMPQVLKRVEEKFDTNKCFIGHYEPDKAISMGAALIAKGFKLKDNLKHSYGIVLVDGSGKYYLHNILMKNESFPIKHSIDRLSASEDDQKAWDVEIFTNDSPDQKVYDYETFKRIYNAKIKFEPGIKKYKGDINLYFEMNDKEELVVTIVCPFINGGQEETLTVSNT